MTRSTLFPTCSEFFVAAIISMQSVYLIYLDCLPTLFRILRTRPCRIFYKRYLNVLCIISILLSVSFLSMNALLRVVTVRYFAFETIVASYSNREMADVHLTYGCVDSDSSPLGFHFSYRLKFIVYGTSIHDIEILDRIIRLQPNARNCTQFDVCGRVESKNSTIRCLLTCLRRDGRRPI